MSMPTRRKTPMSWSTEGRRMLVPPQTWLLGSATVRRLASFHRVRPLRESAGMISLRPHRARQWTSEVLPRFQATEHVGEIIARPPPQILPRPLVDVDTFDAREHA